MPPTTPALVACPGCGALVPAGDGPVHAYYGAAAGCWALYGEVLAREYGDFRYARVHRLTVDAYAVQHPGTPEPRTIQSVAVHLVGLYLSLECAVPGGPAAAVLQAAADRSASFHWLEPPPSLGAVTVRDVHAAGADPDGHQQAVRRWAESAWAAWSAHHAQVRAWAEAGDVARRHSASRRR